MEKQIINGDVEINGQLLKGDYKALYHLGAYDSVDTSNSGYDLIGRNGGRKNARDFTWVYMSGYGFYSNEALPNFKVLSGTTAVAPVTTTLFRADTQEHVMAQTGQNSIAYVYNTGQLVVSTSITSLSDFLAYIQDMVIEYEFADDKKYTEKVLKNQPLSTLDQNGENWLRNEYEKTLNLWNAGSSWSNSNTDDDSSFYSCVYVKGVLKGEERQASDGFKYITFTTPNETNLYFSWKHNGQTRDLYIILNGYVGLEPNKTYTLSYQLNGHYPNSVGGLSISNIMLNEGSTPRPFIEYSGSVMHAADVQGVLLWKNGNPNTVFAGTTISVADMSAFREIVVTYRYYFSNCTPTHFKIDYSIGSNGFISNSNQQANEVASRQIVLNSATEIQLYTAYMNHQSDNSFIVPIAIYGIK